MGNDYCDGCGQDISKNGYCKCTRANISTIGRHRNPDDCDSCDVLQKVIAELRAKLKIAEERGARRLAEYIVMETEHPRFSVDDLMTIWKRLK